MGETTTNTTPTTTSSYILGLIDQCEQILQQHRTENPDLYRLIDLKKQRQLTQVAKITTEEAANDHAGPINAATKSTLNPILRGFVLRTKIRESQHKIRQKIMAENAEIVSRTQAHNRKSNFTTIDEEREFRSDMVAAQIRAWRSMLPTVIRRFSRIKDPRRTKSIKHKLAVLMMFGLFAFIFRLSSRREMNRELTGPVIFDHLRKLFPDLDSIPHADTLARLLENINSQHIEEAHIDLIKDLVKKKKFRKLLIHGCLPVTVDGTQKLYRNGLLQDSMWCERKIGSSNSDDKQQYVYVIEANITLKNGLTIPLITEYLYRSNNVLEQDVDKQDSETTAFERLATRLKKYFPRQKLIFFADAMYATQYVMGILHKNHWEYIIRLPKNKLKNLAKWLNRNKSLRQSIPGQSFYRKRKQEFYWENHIPYGYEWRFTIHLAGCFEKYEKVDNKTGGVIQSFSEHVWISSIPVNINNVHELFNLGARKKELIEDSINTEKNRGYQYKHAFSYNWNAMKGFHLLMRLAHAINAISEFSKKLKHYIKELGCGATLKLIKDTLFNPWLSPQWYSAQRLKAPQLRLQIE